MPNWGEVLKNIQGTQMENPLDIARKKYLRILHEYTNRNVIAYYSGFLQKDGASAQIDDNDKNAFMQAVHKLDKDKGLDIILHTPGGNTAATESIVIYLKKIFGEDIRAIIPQIAMSAGTMIALSCKEIVMGKQSNIGPIDPQFGGMSCNAIIEEFEKAHSDISKDQSFIPIWQPIIAKYHPTFLGDCEKAIEWSETMVRKWLLKNMLRDIKDKNKVVEKIIEELGSHKQTKSHARHIHIDECMLFGIKAVELESLMKDTPKEDCIDFQDCVLTLHHTYMHTFSNSTAIKIIENHCGDAMIIQTNI